jgi:hypothetical protein
MKRKDDFIMQNIDDEWLLVPTGAAVMDLNGLVTLNRTGARVWQLLETERTLDELSAAVAQQFEVEPAAARADVQTFLDEIARIGLLEN